MVTVARQLVPGEFVATAPPRGRSPFFRVRDRHIVFRSPHRVDSADPRRHQGIRVDPTAVPPRRSATSAGSGPGSAHPEYLPRSMATFLRAYACEPRERRCAQPSCRFAAGIVTHRVGTIVGNWWPWRRVEREASPCPRGRGTNSGSTLRQVNQLPRAEAEPELGFFPHRARLAATFWSLTDHAVGPRKVHALQRRGCVLRRDHRWPHGRWRGASPFGSIATAAVGLLAIGWRHNGFRGWSRWRSVRGRLRTALSRSGRFPFR